MELVKYLQTESNKYIQTTVNLYFVFILKFILKFHLQLATSEVYCEFTVL